jgi:hypothetical protein
MRNFQVEILDCDGEMHLYAFSAVTAWHVLRHIAAQMARGDFYGHKAEDSVNVTLTEMRPEWDGDGQHFIVVKGR